MKTLADHWGAIEKTLDRELDALLESLAPDPIKEVH